MKLGLNPRRLAIFSFFDEHGIVDDYVEHYLRELLKCVESVLIVINGEIVGGDLPKLEQFGKVIVRENAGFDIWGYKTGMEYFGWDKLLEFDEIVLCNDTMFGPVFPFSEVFDKMASRDELDFWGMTKWFETDDFTGMHEDGKIPEHIQSYFQVFRKSAIGAKEFQSYWENLPALRDYFEAIGLHESAFSRRLESFGLKGAAAIEADDLGAKTIQPIHTYPVQLVRDRGLPLFKRKVFYDSPDHLLVESTRFQLKELVNYVRDFTSYDVDLIWKPLLRHGNQYDLFSNLGLTYFLPDDYLIPAKGVARPKTALIMHLYFEDLFEESFEYAKNMPADADVFVTTNTPEKQRRVEEIFGRLECNRFETILVENRGRDVSALLVGAKEVVQRGGYEVICWFHDKKTKYLSPRSSAISFAKRVSENALASPDYVENVIRTFGNNPCLGILSPSQPTHHTFFSILGQEWSDPNNFECARDLASTLGIRAKMDFAKAPIAPYGAVFWFRPAALEKLFAKNWDYTDFDPEPLPNDGTISHAIERIHPFVAQDAGFYPAVVSTNRLGALDYSSLKHYLLGFMGTVQKYQGPHPFAELLSMVGELKEDK